MNKIKAKTLWFIILASFILAIGLIVGCAYTDGALNTFLIVLLVINFIFITIAIQAATLKTFKYKGKSIKYPTKDYFCDIDLYKKDLIINSFDLLDKYILELEELLEVK